MVKFVVSFLALGPTGPTEVEYIDSCHGHVHLHHMNGTTPPLAKLDSTEDVQRAFDAIEPFTQDRARILTEKGTP